MSQTPGNACLSLNIYATSREHSIVQMAKTISCHLSRLKPRFLNLESFQFSDWASAGMEPTSTTLPKVTQQRYGFLMQCPFVVSELPALYSPHIDFMRGGRLWESRIRRIALTAVPKGNGTDNSVQCPLFIEIKVPVLQILNKQNNRHFRLWWAQSAMKRNAFFFLLWQCSPRDGVFR